MVAEAKALFAEIRDGTFHAQLWGEAVDAVLCDNMSIGLAGAVREITSGQYDTGRTIIVEMVRAGMDLGFRLGKLKAAGEE